jgi:hypothetical protein
LVRQALAFSIHTLLYFQHNHYDPEREFMKFQIFFFSFILLVVNVRCMEVAAQPLATDKKNPKNFGPIRYNSFERLKKSALLERYCPGAVMNPLQKKERSLRTSDSKDPNTSHPIARSQSDKIVH